VTVTTAKEKNISECREGQIEAQRSQLKGGRASQGRGEATGGAVVDREGLGLSAHGGQGVHRRRTQAATADPGLGVK
jgi:hypothetical protein